LQTWDVVFHEFKYKKEIIMKKLIIIFLMILCGCGTNQTPSSFYTDTHTKTIEPPKTIRNAKCEDIQSFKVFQVLDRFVLANVCNESDTIYCFGHIVYIPKEKGKIYYDDQMIIVKSGECPVYVGTYKYQTRDGLLKTVPIVKIINSQVPNPEYKEWVKSNK